MIKYPSACNRNGGAAEVILVAKLTELGGPLPVDRRARPVIWPRDVAVFAQRDHRLDGEGHAGFAFAHRLVLAVVRHVRRAVEQRVDSVAAVRPDYAAIPGLGVFLDSVSELSY